MKNEKLKKDIEKICKKYNLDMEQDIFYTRANEPTKLIYNKYGVKIYLNENYGYIDIIKEREEKSDNE